MADRPIIKHVTFTGHRNAITDLAHLSKLHNDYPNAIWIHGGAIGFDTQVSEFCYENEISEVIIRPKYTQFGKSAPLIRNKEMVDMANVIAACYDGRNSGGTYYTVNYAKQKMKLVILLPAYRIIK